MKLLIPKAGLAALCVPLLAINLMGAYLDDIGYTSLQAQLAAEGTVLPDGTGVSVSQVEASVSTTSNLYFPTAALYSGVTMTDKTSSYASGISWHADMVAEKLYGDSSMGSGITTVGVYYVNAWLGSSFLNYGTNAFPKTETADVQNHSWVGTVSTSSDANILSRLDYSVEKDDYVAVVGVNNNDDGTGTAKNLLSSAYNVISVGVTDGTHVSGTATINAGVTYPLLVVPVSSTSEATAVVSSAATLLIQTARSGTATSTNGDKSEVIKAVLLAGATKSEFASWSNSETSPLDATYGAGELNVQNSYNIMVSGEQSTGYSTPVAGSGWDYGTLTLSTTASYYFNLTSSGDMSIALTWNAIYSGNNGNSLSLSLANLNLSLYSVSSDGSQGSLIEQSAASSGNVEYLWLADLGAGSYAINVNYAGNTSGTTTSASYALAWQTASLTAIPEPSTLGLILTGGFLVLCIAIWRGGVPRCS